MDIFTVTRRADDLYHERAREGAVEASVSILASAAEWAEKYEAQLRLARALFFLGQQADSKNAKRQLHAAAIGAGERAARLNPERVEGHFWLGVNLALFAEASGGIKAARAVLRARSTLRRAVAISAEYHGAGPLRVLARLEHKAPWFLGGSRKRSRQYFDRALALAPSNTVTLIYAAELAIDDGDRNHARLLLEKVVQTRIDSEWEFENRRDREIARSLLARMNDGNVT